MSEQPIFQFCIHRRLDGQEMFVAIPDAQRFILHFVIDEWRKAGAWRRLADPESVIAGAVDKGLDEALRLLVDHTVRM